MMRDQKKNIRTRMLDQRDALAPKARQEKSELIMQRLVALSAVKDARSWFVYVSFKSEVETHNLIQSLLAGGKQVSIPYIERNTRRMVASRLTNFSHDLIRGYYGGFEPAPGCVRPVKAGDIDVVIVPGAVFGEDGYRIGYSGGYYDRYLRECRALSIGIAFDAQVLATVPYDGLTDARLDCLLTETRFIDFRSAGT